jgi:hypothetical protein
METTSRKSVRRLWSARVLPSWCSVLTMGLSAVVSGCEPTAAGNAVAGGDVYTPPRGVPAPGEPEASPPPISVGFPPTHPISSLGPDVIDDPTDKAEAPTLTSISPDFGAATGGDVVVVRGAEFVDGAVVMFGDRPSPNTFFIDDSWLNVTTPEGDPGLVDVRVVNPDGQEAVIEEAFRFDAALTLSSADPTSGPTDGGTVVTLRGTGFAPGVVAVFGDRMAPVTEVISGTELRVTTPPGLRGPVDVRVVFDDGGSAVLGGAFEYASPAVVEDVAPRVGLTAGGEPVILTGRHFTPDTRIDFGNAPASVTAVAVDGTWIEVRTPPNAPGLAGLVVDNGAGVTVVPGAFVYRGTEAQPLTLWAVHPGTGPLKGGNTISLLATGLGQGEVTTVRIGGVLATQVVVDVGSNEVRAVVPPSAAMGPTSVELRQTLTSTSLPSAYVYADTIVVTTLSPYSGNEAGGDVVTIAGAGFEGAEPVQVTFGGLPVSDAHVASDNQLVVVSPPCSPGQVEVKLTRGDDVVHVPGGWFCRASAIRLLAVDPPEVAQSGGALVRVIGTGLPDDATISLGGKLVAAEWDSQNAVFVRAPASEPGSYDVGLSSASLGSARTLPRALRVFDPENRLAAISGPPILRNLNVTIIDGGTGATIPGATAILGADPTTALQCLTDGRGQCTIGARELRGPQTITATREGFSAYTVAGFDARDVTLFIRQLAAPGQAAPPGDPGAGGDGQLDVNTLLGTISGKVVGLGKYVQLPPPSCEVIGSPDGQQCKPCGVSADCASGLTCTTLEGSGSYCLKSCASQADCSAGYQCGTLGTASCVPSGGEPSVRCETTRRSLFGSNPEPGPGANVELAEGEYEIESRLGDVVVFCIASYVAPSGVTIPVAMGISETVVVHLGDVITDVDVVLDIPLRRTVRAHVFDLPVHSGGITPIFYNSGLDMGSEGWLPVPQTPAWKDGQYQYFVGFPESLAPFGDDAAYTFYASVNATTGGNVPSSYRLLDVLGTLDVSPIVARDDDGWRSPVPGMRFDLSSAHAVGPEDIWAVGPFGRLVHRGPLGWAVQPKFTNESLLSVHGFAGDDLWAVGERGTLLHFDGVTWTPVPSGVGWTLRGVYGDVVVGDGGILERQGDAFVQRTLLHSKGLNAVVTAGSGPSAFAVAVGAAGKVAIREGGQWTVSLPAPAQIDWYGVAIAGDGVWAVGSAGTIGYRDAAGTWTFEKVGRRTLRAVTVLPSGDVIAAGDAGTLLRRDAATGVFRAELVIPDEAGTAEEALARDGLDLQGLTIAGDTVLAVGRGSLPVGPWMAFPLPESPSANGTWDGKAVDWRYEGQGAEPTFNQMFMSSSDGFTVWTVIAAGPLDRVALPPLEQVVGGPVIPTGSKYFNLIRGLNPNFDIDGYRFNQFSIWLRTAWSVAFGGFY